MTKTSIVLLSGGLDSVVNLKQAQINSDVRMALTFDYGQVSAPREIEAASLITQKAGIPHYIIELPWMKNIGGGLTTGKIPLFDNARIDDAEYGDRTARAVWVPNRNGVMINIAAAFADAMKIDQIVVGFNLEEGATFPDNTPRFIERVNSSLEDSTLHHPIVVSYTIQMNKREILNLGREIDASLEYIWSCYQGGQAMCGECESCRRLKRALNETEYWDQFKKIHFRGFSNAKK